MESEMNDTLATLVFASMLVVGVLTRKRARKLGGILILALAVIFLVAGIADPANRPSYMASFLVGVMVALSGLGVIPKTITKSSLPYRIDGVIEVVIAAVCLMLGIAFPEVRLYFVLSFLFLAGVGLGRLGAYPFTARGEPPADPIDRQ
jgi:hypothetical protein